MDAVGNILSSDPLALPREDRAVRAPARMVPAAAPGLSQSRLAAELRSLPIETYTRNDTLMPYWENLSPSQAKDGNPRVPHCPRCDAKVEMEAKSCPPLRTAYGRIRGYSAIGWPRKDSWQPDLPDDYSFYFIAAYVHAPTEMRRMTLRASCEGRYKVFLNGREVGVYSGPHRYPQWDLDDYAVELKEGWNLLLVKLAHDTIRDDHRFYHSKKEERSAFLARMVMPDNRPVTVQNYAKRNFAPERQLRITVSDPIPIGIGSTARPAAFPGRHPCLLRIPKHG